MIAIDTVEILRASLLGVHAPKQEEPVPSGRHASVAIIVADDDPHILFIKRSSHPDDPWSGHVALPGGRVDPDDLHVEATARRETFEEVGLQLSERDLWGPLRPVQARAASGAIPMWIFPHVYRITGARADLVLSKSEVESARWIPVTTLIDPTVLQEVEFQSRLGRMRMPAWVIEDFTIWGLTYFMVKSFLSPIIPRK